MPKPTKRDPRENKMKNTIAGVKSGRHASIRCWEKTVCVGGPLSSRKGCMKLCNILKFWRSYQKVYMTFSVFHIRVTNKAFQTTKLLVCFCEKLSYLDCMLKIHSEKNKFVFRIRNMYWNADVKWTLVWIIIDRHLRLTNDFFLQIQEDKRNW